MAKKTKKKPATRAATAKTRGSSRAATRSKKTVTKKAAAKKSASKKPAAKKTTKKATTKKTAAKKTAAKKTAAKKKTAGKNVTTKKTAKKTASKKTAAKKTASKKTSAKKPASKKTSAKKPASKKTTAKPTSAAKSAKAPAKPAANAQAAGAKGAGAAGADKGKKTGRKGITIVSDRSKKRPKSKQPRKPFVTPGGSLLGPGVVRKPLIPSGPNATAATKTTAADPSAPKKSPFNKRELTKFKSLLLIKRAEVFGDIEQMEADALRSSSGDLSHLPQHLADQGSDSYEQSLSLDLAAADRRLIKEIDDALARIDNRTYGVCERTGKPIRKTRLQELPWARYSIEAAREMERRGGF